MGAYFGRFRDLEELQFRLYVGNIFFITHRPKGGPRYETILIWYILSKQVAQSLTGPKIAHPP